MNRIERLLCCGLIGVLLSIGAWYGVCRYGIEQRQAGYDAAVADGKKYLDLEAQIARLTEDDLRARLRAKDGEAYRKEREHAESLEAAKRRMRAGIDSLRCPAARTIPDTAAADSRPAAGGPAADREGPAVVSEVAAEILGDAADVAGLVRRYERVIGRFEACRALSAQ